MNIRMLSVGFAFLTSLVVTPAARAQTAQEVAEDFSGLGRARSSIVVVDEAGTETRGQLLRFDSESLTMRAGGRDLTFDRQHVTRVYQRGDSLKNGMIIGLVAGAAFGVAGGVIGTDCGGFFEPARSCTAGEKARLGAVFGGLFGALGMGVGVGIDALVPGRRLIYERRRSTGLSLTVAW